MASWESGGSEGLAGVPPPPAQPFSDRGGGHGDGRRVAAAVLLFISVILAGVSAYSPWWYDTVNGSSTVVGATSSPDQADQTTTETLEFLPGTSSYVTCSGEAYWQPCDGGSSATWSYSDSGMEQLGTNYVTVHVMVWLAVALGILSSVFMGLGAAGRGWGRWHFHATHILALMVVVLMILAPTMLLLVQPGSIANATPYQDPAWEYILGPQAEDCGANTPNTTYWNSCTYSEGSAVSFQATWGAGLGWYLAVASGAMALLGGILFLSSRPENLEGAAGPLARRDAGLLPAFTGPQPPEAGSLAGPLAGGVGGRELVPALGYEGPPVTSNRTTCRACGHLNPPGSVLCARCHGSLL